MIQLFLTICLLVATLAQPSGGAYYVAPYGSTSGDGSPERPLTLSWSLSSAPSGSTVWLIPGSYVGSFSANVPGVTYRSVPGTRAKLDGNLTVNAADTTFLNLEITNTSWLTRTGVALPQSTTCLCIFAPRVHILNSWVHDLGGGIQAYNGSGGATADLIVRGSLIYNNGWQDTNNPRSAHGHNLYMQNDDAGRKVIQGNVILNPYGFNVQFYGSGGPTAQLRHFDLLDNVVSNGRILIGGGQAASDIHVRDNRQWGDVVQVGYTYGPNGDAEIVGNTLTYLQVSKWTTLDVHDNTIAGDGLVNFEYPANTSLLTYTWNLNTYYQFSSGSPFNVSNDTPSFKSWAQWRTRTGFDVGSIYTQARPSAPWVGVQPNADDPNRGIVTIYNWPSAATVQVDLAPLNPTAGASYRLVSAQNPAESLVFQAGAPVSVPTSGWSVATPIGAAVPFRPNTAPAFLVFLVEPA